MITAMWIGGMYVMILEQLPREFLYLFGGTLIVCGLGFFIAGLSQTNHQKGKTKTRIGWFTLCTGLLFASFPASPLLSIVFFAIAVIILLRYIWLWF